VSAAMVEWLSHAFDVTATCVWCPALFGHLRSLGYSRSVSFLDTGLVGTRVPLPGAAPGFHLCAFPLACFPASPAAGPLRCVGHHSPAGRFCPVLVAVRVGVGGVVFFASVPQSGWLARSCAPRYGRFYRPSDRAALSP
jgi:hypothetical protein